jgi:hypothetical protein
MLDPEGHKLKTASNRASSNQILRSAGVPFTEHNFSPNRSPAHLVVANRWDFWPGTGKWKDRRSLEQGRGVRELIRAYQGSLDKWQPATKTPTSAAINALPDWVRQYIHDLEARADPAGDVQARAIQEDQIAQLGVLAVRSTDLLIALRSALVDMSRVYHVGYEPGMLDNAIASSRAAIAKAEGVV